jgi:hypothetical protein
MSKTYFLILVLFILGAFRAIPAKGQQPPDCSNCTCAMPSMLGITLSTSSNHGPCDSTTPHTLDVNRYGRFWAIAGNEYTISVCGEQADTRIYITTNTTVPGVHSCDDDGCGSEDGPSSVRFTPMNSNTYRIYVFNASCGTLFPEGTLMQVSIACAAVPPPVNDDPCGAIELPHVPAGEFTMATNHMATNSNVASPLCSGSLYQGSDVWFTATVPETGLLCINTMEEDLCAGAFALYMAESCSGPFTMVNGTCTTVGFDGMTSPPALMWNAMAAGIPPGATVYIRYWERNGNENGSFGIQVGSCGTVGMPEPSAGQARLFPNPNDGRFTLVSSLHGPVDLLLTDVAGRVLHRERRVLGSAEACLLDLQGQLAAGRYMLAVMAEGQREMLPLQVE